MKLALDVIVEIPIGSMYKYEIDKKTGNLSIDRPLPAWLPYNYGFVPNTLHGDGDPLDICIIGQNPIYPLTKVTVFILGAFICNDNGESDDKLIGIVSGESYSDSEANDMMAEVKYYLEKYKKGFIVERFVNTKEAFEIYQKDQATYSS